MPSRKRGGCSRPPLQRPQHRNLLRGWSRRERQACRHSHSSPESISGRPPLQSRPRLSRCRDPRSSRPSLGSQELSLLRCQGMAEGNRLPSLESPDSSQKFVLFELFVFKIIPACSNTGWDFFFVYSHHFSPPSTLSSHLACIFSSPKSSLSKKGEREPFAHISIISYFSISRRNAMF